MVVYFFQLGRIVLNSSPAAAVMLGKRDIWRILMLLS